MKLRPFENELARNYSSMSSGLTRHLNQMLEAAFAKFDAWRNKKIPPALAAAAAAASASASASARS